MTYPQIPDLPPAPLRSQPEDEYAATASTFVGAMTPWSQAINAAGAWIQATVDNLADYLGLTEQARDDALDARDAAQVAAQLSGDRAGESQSWASNSQMYSTMAAATAAFKGEWSELTGPLNIPASAYHSGQFWQLLRDIPNVASSEPGVSADWVSPYSQAAQAWVPVSGSVTLDANVPYAVLWSGAGQVLTLPPSPSANDTVELASRGGDPIGVVIARNGSTIMDLPEDVVIDEQITGLRLIYLSNSWRFVQ